jgi:ribosome-associated toxin RatA of RatAB toxin-antitoxin module
MNSIRPVRLARCATLAVLLALVGAAAIPAAPERIAVRVEKSGQRITIDVVALADAPVAQAWSVFTDYEAMPTFLKNVTTSRVLKREGNSLTVEQAGAVRVAFMRFAFHAVRNVELAPMREIRSGQLSGDFKEYASLTSFSLGEHGGARIHHHGSYVPKSWIPPVIGKAMIESETRRQYEQFLTEVERRAADR